MCDQLNRNLHGLSNNWTFKLLQFIGERHGDTPSDIGCVCYPLEFTQNGIIYMDFSRCRSNCEYTLHFISIYKCV